MKRIYANLLSLVIIHCKEPIPKIRNKYSQKRNCAATVPIPHSWVCERFMYSPTIDLPILLEEICGPILGIFKSLTEHMNVEIGTEAAKF
jgi:hypothetical protein